jgi:Hemerythrin HHE cation binding domain
MSIDHEFIARYRDEIAKARADLGGARGDAAASAATRLARAAAALEALVEVHLAKEERAYLPLLATHTSDADQAALLRRMHGGDGGGEEAVIDVPKRSRGRRSQ